MTPEQAEDFIQYAEHTIGQIHEARRLIQDFVDDLNDPESETRQELDLLSERLGAATDDLRERLDQIGGLLVERFKGRCAAIELNKRWALMFWHVKGVWGLYVVHGSSGQLQRLTSTPKECRVLAASALEDLWLMLQDEDEPA